MIEIAGRGALVVGARRLGIAAARRLAKEKMNLVIAYRSSQTEAETLRKELVSQGATASLVRGDLASEEDVARMIDTARERLGDLYAVVNLASGFRRATLDDLDAAAWDKAMIDAKGCYTLAVHAARRMRTNQGPTRGHLIFFGDWAAGETPYAGYLPYLTSKAAIHFMTRAFAVELAPLGILVNAIAPGPTVRPAEIDEATWRREVVARTPLKRESSAEEIAEFLVSLLKSETLTGEILRIDAGRHLAGPGAEG